MFGKHLDQAVLFVKKVRSKKNWRTRHQACLRIQTTKTREIYLLLVEFHKEIALGNDLVPKTITGSVGWHDMAVMTWPGKRIV